MRTVAKEKPGRTADGYKHQPAPHKWKCSTCINIARNVLLKQEKGRGHANAKEILQFSFASRNDLLRHQGQEHGS